jgi:phytoene synthase
MKQIELDRAYAHCEFICRNASTTFYSSFSALENEKRKAVHAVYALCRWVDDIVDGDEEVSIHADEQLLLDTKERDQIIRSIHAGKSPAHDEQTHFSRLMALVSIRQHLIKASKQEITQDAHPVFIAIQDVFAKYPIRLQDFETILEGMEDDLFHVQCNTWDELRAYCYKVASAVGLVLIEIYGYEDRSARLHAIDLGIQMQLINVLRDVNEDLERGRIYLPVGVLAEYNIDVKDLHNPKLAKMQNWKAFILEYLDIVRRHQESAQHLFDFLEPRARIQPQIMMDAYVQIFEEVLRRSGDIFSTRLGISLRNKLRLWVRIHYLKLRARFLQPAS